MKQQFPLENQHDSVSVLYLIIILIEENIKLSREINDSLMMSCYLLTIDY